MLCSLPAWTGVQLCLIPGDLMGTKAVRAGTALLGVFLAGGSQGLCGGTRSLGWGSVGTLIPGQLLIQEGAQALLSQGGNVICLGGYQVRRNGKKAVELAHISPKLPPKHSWCVF